MRTRLVMAGGVLALALFGGCKDERTVSEDDAPAEQAKTECRLLFDCGCEPGYATEGECVETRTPEYEQQWAAGRASGLTWDGSCLGTALDALDELGCQAPEVQPPGEENPDFEQDECERPCLPYHGDVELGAPCTPVSNDGFSNCAQGLFCFDGVCADPCALFDASLAEGEACRSGFEVLGNCAEELVCDAGGSDTCIALPGPGQPCPQGACAEGSWCQQIVTDTMCVALLANGGECNADEECISAYCQSDVCADVPEEGQPCTDRCTGALFCDAGTCSAGAAAGESCEARPCAFGLLCLEGVCDVGPGEGEPCADGQCAIEYVCGGDSICAARDAIVCSLFAF